MDRLLRCIVIAMVMMIASGAMAQERVVPRRPGKSVVRYFPHEWHTIDLLVGAKIGSRVLMSVPPKQGYGKKGNEQAGIKGTDTLVFVVDLVSTK